MMSRLFFTYTAIVEALSGLGLLIIPGTVARILLGAELSAPLEIVLAMVAGAATCSIALLSWLSRSDPNARVGFISLLFYNFAVSLILLYAALGLGFKGIPLWGVIIFHFFQTVYGLVLLRKQFLFKNT
jgi:hypothetical protein